MYADNVRAVMARALGVPVTALSSEDNVLTGLAARRGYPVAPAALGVDAFRPLGVRGRDLVPLATAFMEADTAKGGALDFAAFQALLAPPARGAGEGVLALFRALDWENVGAVDLHAVTLGWLLATGRAPGGWRAAVEGVVRLLGVESGAPLTAAKLLTLPGVQEEDVAAALRGSASVSPAALAEWLAAHEDAVRAGVERLLQLPTSS